MENWTEFDEAFQTILEDYLTINRQGKIETWKESADFVKEKKGLLINIARNKFIEEACIFLKNSGNYVRMEYNNFHHDMDYDGFDTDKLIKDFKKEISKGVWSTKAKKMKNKNGTFRLVNENGENLEIDFTPVASIQPTHIIFKNELEDWEVEEAASQYGLEIIN